MLQELDYSQFDMPGAEPADEENPQIAAPAAPEIAYDRNLGTRRVTLFAPVKVDGKLLKAITIRMPTQGDIDDFGNGVLENRRALLCRLTDQHPAVLKSLAWPDAEALQQMYNDMLPDFMKD